MVPEPHFERASVEHTGSRSSQNPPRLVPGCARAEPQPTERSPLPSSRWPRSVRACSVASQALYEVAV